MNVSNFSAPNQKNNVFTVEELKVYKYMMKKTNFPPSPAQKQLLFALCYHTPPHLCSEVIVHTCAFRSSLLGCQVTLVLCKPVSLS